MTDIQTVGVIGAGTMGNGIAHVFARSGYRVLLCEVERRFLDRGLETIRRNLGREAEKGRITVNDVDDALARIEGTLDRTDLAEANFIVEAATEAIAESRLRAVYSATAKLPKSRKNK